MTKSRNIADSINRIDSSAADATAMTIDANENVGIGTTSNSPVGENVAGIGLLNNGSGQFSRDGGTALLANRKNSHGEVIRVTKDGSTVGSIGSRGSGTSFITLKTSSGAGAGLTGSDNRILPMDESALADNNTDLGMSSYRFKDLYLSGGAYLGGTGAANHLDDYEEGTFTPVLDGVSGWSGSSGVGGKYTKIGNTVHVFIHMTSNTGATGTANYRITGLPFSADNTEGAANVSISRMFGVALTTTDYICRVTTNGEIQFFSVNGDNTVNNLTYSGNTLRFTLSATYQTA